MSALASVVACLPAKFVDYSGYASMYAADVSDSGRGVDAVQKLTVKCSRDYGKSVDFWEKVASWYKDCVDIGVGVDRAAKGMMRSVWDYPYVHEYLFKWVGWRKVLVDYVVSLDSLVYGVGKAFYVRLSDYCVGEFVESKDVLAVKREAPLVAERLIKCMVRSALDSTVVADWIWAVGGKLVILFDSLVGEHVPVKGIKKVGVDGLSVMDWIVKLTVRSLVDVGFLAESFSLLYGKLAILRDFLVGEHTPVRDLCKVGFESVKVSDWKFLDISKMLVDVVRTVERFFAGKVVELFDRVLSDLEIGFGRALTVKDKARIEELTAKLGFTLMGEEVWRRVYHRVWYDLIEVADQNTKIVIAQALIDAFKAIYDKLKG